MLKGVKTFFKKKTRATRGLKSGSFTPLEIERSKGSFVSVSSNKDMKPVLPVIKKHIIIPETQASDDTLQYSQVHQRYDNNDSDPNSNKIVDDDFSLDVIPGTYDRKSILPVIKEATIIPETQASSDTMPHSYEEKKDDNSVEDKNPVKSFIHLQEELQIIADSDSDLDEIMDSEFLSDTIPGTNDALKKKCGVGDKDTLLKKNQDSRIAQVNIIEPPITHADASTLCTNDVLVGNAMESQVQKQKYKPAKIEEKKLAVLRVKMRHAVLPQHAVESTAGTRTMNASERARFQKYIKLRKGSFNEAEDKNINENWNTFCQDNKWDPNKPEPFLLMKHYNNKKFLLNNLENRRNFVRCLAHGLPDRCLYSVHNRFKNLFTTNKKTDNYTHEEDQQILQYVKAYPHLKTAKERDHKFANLALVLKRTRASVWRRYQVLKKQRAKIEKSTS